tara:strand:- start:43787 stop:44278 length:492 start_codon:yes stop_codon:yes gene_type:complete
LPIRHLAKPHDLNAIVALINEAYVVESHFITGPRIAAEEVAASIAAEEVVALRDREVVIATAHMAVHQRTGHLGLISVHPKMQGQGLGRRIIEIAESLAIVRGATQMQLEVVNLREELPPFYRKLGYVETGTAPFDDPKPTLLPVHFVTMGKPLAKNHEQKST